LTTLILLSASLLPGQPPRLQQNQSGQPAVCNDGTITFRVARAHRHAKDILFGGGRWEIWGWFNVDPGKCSEIGPATVFEPGGWLGNGDAVTLLAVAFWDSKGVWRGIKVQPGDSGWFYPIYPSNQQICVQSGEFHYTRDSLEQSDLARVCDRTTAGYVLIPASFMYKGSSRTVPLVGGPDLSPDYVHVKIADDRAITSGRTIGSAGISQGLASGGASQSSGDASPSLCGKVSCWDLFVQGLKQGAKDNEAQRAAANANNNPPQRASTNLPPPPAATPPPPIDDDDPIGQGGFIAPSDSPAPASNGAKSMQWVRDDVVAYIEASQTGFAAYKKGDAQLSQGYRMWDSSVKPSQAKGCWVVQGATSTTLSCLLLERADLNDLRSYYTELNKDIIASLPQDWTTQMAPPFGGDLPNQGYGSSSGAHLEVWIARAAAEPIYQIQFQLVSAH
jgi:hypothetical protein